MALGALGVHERRDLAFVVADVRVGAALEQQLRHLRLLGGDGHLQRGAVHALAAPLERAVRERVHVHALPEQTWLASGRLQTLRHGRGRCGWEAVSLSHLVE